MKDWKDEPDETTPITSTELERIETGVVEGITKAETAATEVIQGRVELASAAEMTTGTDLTRPASVKRIVDYVSAAISTAISGIPSASAATESAAGIVELASSAEMTTGTDLTRAPAVKRVADYVIAAIATSAATINASIASLSSSMTTALGGKADKTGSWQQFSDVADVAYTDGDVPMFDTGALQPTDLSSNFAPVDSNLRLDSSAWQQYFIPTVVIEEGDIPPGTFPAYGLVGKLPAAASLIPILLASGSVRAANNVVLTLPEAVVAGSYIGFSLSWENSTPFDHISGAFGGTGAGTGVFDFGTLSIPNTTAGVLNGFVKLLTDAASGSTITFTARDVSNAAINRSHLLAAIYRLPNLISSSPRDQQVANGGASTSTLSAITAALSSDTGQPNEIAIGSANQSAGTSPNLRDISATGSWALVVDILSDNGTNGRRLFVAYQVLTAIGRPALTTTVTLTGTATQTGLWAAKLDTFRGI